MPSKQESRTQNSERAESGVLSRALEVIANTLRFDEVDRIFHPRTAFLWTREKRRFRAEHALTKVLVTSDKTQQQYTGVRLCDGKYVVTTIRVRDEGTADKHAVTLFDAEHNAYEVEPRSVLWRNRCALALIRVPQEIYTHAPMLSFSRNNTIPGELPVLLFTYHTPSVAQQNQNPVHVATPFPRKHIAPQVRPFPKTDFFGIHEHVSEQDLGGLVTNYQGEAIGILADRERNSAGDDLAESYGIVARIPPLKAFLRDVQKKE
jgi:hypothetical protein